FFGIGIESSAVVRVTAPWPAGECGPGLDTYVGLGINVAARLEATTKSLFRSLTILGPEVHHLLCRDLLGADYRAELCKAADFNKWQHERDAANDRMRDHDRSLCLSFLHLHSLKGLDAPQPVFRIADTL